MVDNDEVMVAEDIGQTRPWLAKALLLAIMFGSATLIWFQGSSDQLDLDPRIQKLRFLLVGATILALVFRCSLRFRIPKTGGIVLWTWIAFSSFVLVSSVAHQEGSSAIGGLWLLFGIPFLFFSVLPRSLGRYAGRTIVVALLFGHLPYVVISLATVPVTPFAYMCVFGNPNAMGATGAMLAAGLFALLHASLHPDNSRRATLVLAFGLIATFALILISWSRTSLLSFVAMFLTFCLAVISSWNTNRTPVLKILASVVAIVLLFVWLGGLASSYGELVTTVTAGVEGKTGTSGRDVIWQKAFSEISMLGYGKDYFTSVFGLGAHNVFVEYLGEYGIVSSLCLFCCALMSVFSAYVYATKQAGQNPYAFAPLIVIISFWVMSLGENMFGLLGNGLTLACMLSIGTIIQGVDQD